MAEINIQKKVETDSGWVFQVELSEGGNESMIYQVELHEDDWQEITGGECPPEKLIIKSFEFLLEREPKESILRKFNLTLIDHYFPEYYEEIKKVL